MGWVQLSSLVRSKRHVTACAIGPKGEARTLGLRAPSVSKAKLGYLARVHYWSPRRSQDTWPVCAISPKGEARSLGLRASSGPYI